LDQKRPWGVNLATDGLSFQPLVFIPVTNLKQLLESLAALLGEPQDAGDGILEMEVFNQRLLFKEVNGWAYISQSPEVLATVPADPTKLLGGLDKTYDIAVRLHIQNIPEVYRTLAIDQLRMGVETGLGRLPDETDEAFDARKKLADQQLDAITGAINDIEQLTLGVALDSTAKSGRLDLTVAAVADSPSGKQLAQLQSTTSDFAGFLLADAAASLNVTAKLPKTDTEQIVAGLTALRARALQHIEGESQIVKDEASKKLAKEMVTEVFDTIQATFETGRIDAGATLSLGEKSMALAVGAFVTNPVALEDALKKLAKLGASEPNFPGIKFDADKHGDIRFHTASIPVPQDQEIAKVLGDKLDVAVGIGPKSVYLAVGNENVKLLKKLIDKSKADASKKQPPVQLNVALAQIFQFAANLPGDRTEAKAMCDELAKSKGKDKVAVQLLPEKNAMTIRIDAQEGVLRILANAAKGMTAGFGGP
jgi:hypothetical protein